MEDKKQKRKGRIPLPASEKKRRRSALVKKRNSERIQISYEFVRWRKLREEKNLKTDTMTAKFLLDSYFRNEDIQKTQPEIPPAIQGASWMGSSTPLRALPKRLKLIQGSDISAVESDSSDRTLTGVETLPESESEIGTPRVRKQKQLLKSGRLSKAKSSRSFINPFELSIELSIDHADDDEEEEDPDSDSDYEPYRMFTAILPDEVNRATEDVTLEELEFGLEIGEDTEEPEDDVDDIPSNPAFVKITTTEQCDNLPEETTCIAFLKHILGLAELATVSCKDCKSLVHFEHSFIGSALYLKWTCQLGHLVYRWCSQPVLNRRLHSVDFLSALAVVSSGNNFGKIALFANMLNLKFLSASTFHRIQGTYLVPAVDNLWNVHQEEVMTSFHGKDLIVLGDGRMDSPGHSAQYCTYTVMENESKKILMMKTLDKRVTDRKSSNLEKKCFELCLQDFENSDVNVTEVVTDAHLGIGALMRTQYPNIKHSNDVWHAAKNLGKKILKAGQRKGCGIILKWSKDIVNHFWYACKTANSYTQFMSIWRGVLHHITNQHSWILAHGDGVNQCEHGPLTDEEARNKPWLDKSTDSAALSALTSVILDKRFLNRIHYLLNFRSTAEIEVFNQLILMYCAKRFSYSPPVYRMRNRLAALDHNMNIDRPLKRNQEGNIIYNRYFNKKSARWSVHPVKVSKSYQHIKTLAKEALKMRIQDKKGMRGEKILEAQDPRRISMHLAPIPPPPTNILVEEQMSRFKSN